MPFRRPTWTVVEASRKGADVRLRLETLVWLDDENHVDLTVLDAPANFEAVVGTVLRGDGRGTLFVGNVPFLRRENGNKVRLVPRG